VNEEDGVCENTDDEIVVIAVLNSVYKTVTDACVVCLFSILKDIFVSDGRIWCQRWM